MKLSTIKLRREYETIDNSLHFLRDCAGQRSYLQAFGRRTTTGVYRPTINRKFCQVCPTVPKTRKSLLLVVTTGFFGVLKGNCTVVVKWWSKCRESTFSKKKSSQNGYQIIPFWRKKRCTAGKCFTSLTFTETLFAKS